MQDALKQYLAVRQKLDVEKKEFKRGKNIFRKERLKAEKDRIFCWEWAHSGNFR